MNIQILQKQLIFIFLFSILSLTPVFGQSAELKYNFNTGDKELDLSLNNINIKAKADINNFISDLSVSYNVEKEKIEKLIKIEKLEPADVMMSVIVADVADKEVEEVVQEYKENKNKGWGVIAKNMGIKPGSKEFHELKNKNKELGGKKKGNNSSKGKK